MGRQISRGAALLSRFRRETAGNFATLGALTAPIALALAAVAIDEGSLYTERRDLQGLADLAAITAASNPANARAAVATALKDNGLSDFVLVEAGKPPARFVRGRSGTTVRVTAGRYAALPTVAVEQRFRPGAEPANAVRVTMERTGRRYFASALVESPELGASAIASQRAEAAFSIGSRLLRVEGGILNAVLGGLLGGNITLSVMDYQALIDADVELFSFMDALATEMRLTGGTYSEVLKGEATVGQIARAAAALPGTDAAVRAALGKIAAGSATARLPVGKLVDLGDAARLAVGSRPSGLAASASVMQMLTAAAAVANGKNQLRLNLGATLPGLLGATVDLAVGEPMRHSPWLAVGERGDVVRTAQTRLLVTVEVGGPGGLLGASIKLPIYLELAFAEAELKSIACTTGRPDSLRVTVAARPGVAELRIADVNASQLGDFERNLSTLPAKLVQTPLATVTGRAVAEIANTTPTSLTFSRAEILNGTVKTVSTRDFTTSLTQSLLADLVLDVKLGPLAVGVPSALTATLGAATPALDTLLYSVLAALGVRLGEADVRVNGAVCGRAVLVQ